MNPLLRKKMEVDMESLTPDEQRLMRLYGTRGKLPTFKHINERKYFDSGDFAMEKAGKAEVPVGSQHPDPQSIPHPATSPVMGGAAANSAGLVGIASNAQLKPILTNPALNPAGSPVPGTAAAHMVMGPDGRPQQAAGSPVKVTSFLNRETSAEDLENEGADQQQQQQQQQQQEGQQAGESMQGQQGQQALQAEGGNDSAGLNNIPIRQ